MRRLASPNTYTDSFPLEWPNDQLVALIEGRRYVVDTGSPASFGREGCIGVLGQTCSIPEEYLGIDAKDLSRMVGSPVDGMLGMDLLGLTQFSILRDKGVLQLGTAMNPPVKQRIPAKTFMGISQLQVWTLAGETLNMFFDTGAKMSYVNPELVQGLKPVDRVQDFYPYFGNFETNVWEMGFEIAGKAVHLRVGVLPEQLRVLLKHVSPNCGVIGTEVLKTFDLVTDVSEDWYAFLPRN